MTWTGGKMFEDIRSELQYNWKIISILAVTLIVVVTITLTIGFKSQELQPIKQHDMGAGVVCYTFNTSIDCLQGER